MFRLHILLLGTFLCALGCDEPPAGPAAAASTTASAAKPTPPTPQVVPTAGVAEPAQDKPAGSDKPESVAAQHVLIAYKGAKNAPATVKRTKEEAKKRAEEVAAKAKAGEDFTALVKDYSDDAATLDRLGSVGKFKADAMVKPFSDAAFALKVDATSDPVESPFGFHVIKRNQ